MTQVPRASSAQPMTAAVPGVFYGWRIVGGAFVILFFTVGIGLYSPPVFLKPLEESFGWSRAGISAGAAIAALVGGLLSPLVGGWIDRYGARNVMTFGGLMLGAAFALLSVMGSLWHFLVINVLVAIGVACVAWIPNQTLVANWFTRRRGLAMGLASAGIGFGGLCIAPLGGALIARLGFRPAYATLAALVLLIVVPCILIVVRTRPADLGLLPDGDPPQEPSPEIVPGDATSGPTTVPGLKLGQSLKSGAFWTLAFCNVVFGFAGGSIIAHLVAFLSDSGFDRQLAAGALGMSVGVSVCGRLLFGPLGDRLPKKLMMALAMFLQAVATLCLFGIHSPLALPAFVIAFGLGLGGLAVTFPLLVGECFGLRAFAKILGVLMIPAMFGGAVGPVLTGRIFDVSGSYTLAFTLHLAAFLIGGCVVAFLRRPALDATTTQSA